MAKGQEKLFSDQIQRDKVLEKLVIEQNKTNERLGKLENSQEEILGRLDNIEVEQKEMKQDLKSIGNTVTRIEFEHGQKLDTLFDAFAFHSQKLDSHDKRLEICEEKLDKQSHQIFYLNSKVQGL